MSFQAEILSVLLTLAAVALGLMNLRRGKGSAKRPNIKMPEPPKSKAVAVAKEEIKKAATKKKTTVKKAASSKSPAKALAGVGKTRRRTPAKKKAPAKKKTEAKKKAPVKKKTGAKK